MFRRLGLIFIFLNLTGCQLFSPVPYRQHYYYQLSQLPPVNAHCCARKNVFVSPVRAAPGYESNGMIYGAHCYELRKFVYHHWVAPPGDMIYNLELQTLAQHKFCVIPPSVTRTKLKLEIRLLMLQQEFCGCHSQVHLKAIIKLTDFQNGNCLNTKIVDIIVPTAKPTPECGVGAANQAVSQLMATVIKVVST